MSAVYSVDNLAALKAINPLSISTATGNRALFEGEKRAVLDTGFAPSWYTWRPSSKWATGVPNEVSPVVIRPTTNPSEGAWVSDSLCKVFANNIPPDTPPNLFKEVNKGIEWIATFSSGAVARYISDGTVWKMLFVSPIINNSVNPPTITPDVVGQYYIYYFDLTTYAAYFSVHTTDSTGWAVV